MDDLGARLTPLSCALPAHPARLLSRRGVGGCRRAARGADGSAPLVPLKHHPPTPRGAPGKRRPLQRCAPCGAGGGSWGGGDPPAPPLPPTLPLYPRAGMRRWEKCNRSLVGVWGVPGHCLEPGSPPAPRHRVPPGDPAASTPPRPSSTRLAHSSGPTDWRGRIRPRVLDGERAHGRG